MTANAAGDANAPNQPVICARSVNGSIYVPSGPSTNMALSNAS